MLNKTIYDILAKTPNAPDYLQFMGWVYLWGAVFHWASALLNCEWKGSYLESQHTSFPRTSRVQLLEICHALFMRHLWFLCLLGLLAVWRSSDYQAVPCLVLRPWRRRRLGRNYLCSVNGHNRLLPPSHITVLFLPPPSQEILRGLWHADRPCSVLWRCVLGKVQHR